MPEVAIKVKVPANRKVTVDIPADVPEGEEIEVVLRRQVVAETRAQRASALQKLFDEVDKLDIPRRTDAEIDAELAAERASWGD